ncbi:M23 family metallopeptidase [Pseudalkalibacillus salsuginis]|uniref:M23 family metallopeptidase n=1 Tax=Pseudalkalibacillus salsuginis TaxID=2910972 RepID=UPI002AFFA95C|nr:M23 family metallopeptidase [Pseudalkalibacillus salsuginis]
MGKSRLNRAMGKSRVKTARLWRIQKITVLTVLVIILGSLGFTATTQASDDRFELIKTVYHVYVGGENIGLVNEKSFVEDIKKDIQVKAEDRFKNVELVINETVEYVPERIFNPEINHPSVKQKLEDRLTIGIQGVKLSFGGKTLGYFKNEEAAEEVLRELKLIYTDGQTLDQLEESGSNKKETEEIEEEDGKKEDKVLSISFDEKVDIEPSKVQAEDLTELKDALSKFKKGTLETQKHEVKKGETIKSIVKKYDLNQEKLYELNPKLNKDDKLKEGQELVVLAYEPYAQVIVKERLTKEYTIDHKTEVKNDDSMLKGKTKIDQKGKDGKKAVQYTITKTNGKVTKEEVLNEEILSKPVKEIKHKGTKVIPSRGTGSFQWPAVGGYVSSYKGQRWGRAHKGIDIARPSERSILAADNGKVISAGYTTSGYGNKIEINHNNGFKTVYAHLASISVSPGQTVKKGQKIGVMGSTGNSTGVHLHFELYKNGALQNPLNYVSQ